MAFRPLALAGVRVAILVVVAMATTVAGPVAALAATASTSTTMTLLAVGDLMCHSGQLSAAHTRAGYAFGPGLEPVAPTIRAADLAIGNLETTLRSSGYSGYPSFRSPTAFAVALKAAGFDVLTTANNHTLDGGASGVRYTSAYLGRLGIAHAGSDNHRWVVVRRKGIRIAILPYTYGTNGIRSPYAGAVSRISLLQIRRDIASARKASDFVVVYLHWGAEYSTRPEASTRKFAHQVIDAGADLILGSHPHVVRPIERYLGHYIVYSMGNFIHGQARALTDLGVMVQVKVIRRGKSASVSSVKVVPVYRDRSFGRGTRTYRTVLVDRALAARDSLISSADSSKLRSYRALCKRMFRGYY